MKQVKPFVMFHGTCREALEFYSGCFGGEITMLKTFAESPIDVPDEHKDRIYNAAFQAEGIQFMASDDLPGNEVTVGSNFALFVTFSDLDEQKAVFEKLSDGGTVLFPLANNFGMLVDKYQIQWMLGA